MLTGGGLYETAGRRLLLVEERMDIKELVGALRFYAQMILNGNGEYNGEF